MSHFNDLSPSPERQAEKNNNRVDTMCNYASTEFPLQKQGDQSEDEIEKLRRENEELKTHLQNFKNT